MGRHCWIYLYPRGQWRNGHDCPLRHDVMVHQAFEQWKKRPTVKSLKMLRRDEHRGKSPVRAGEGVAWLKERGLM